MLDEKDRVFIKALQKILDSATFELKASDVAGFYKVYKWATEVLPNKVPLPQPIKVEKMPEDKPKRKRTKKKTVPPKEG